MRSAKRQCSVDAAAMTSRVKRSRSRGLEGLCIKTFQRQWHGRCKGLEESWEALVAGLWRWTFGLNCGGDGDSAIWIRQMAIDCLLPQFGRGIATAGQGSIVPF